MTVARILREKGMEVITAAAHQTLRDAAQILANRRIGAVVVSDPAGAPLGILSERDIVRAIAQEGAAALDAPVSSHMTAKIVTTTEDAPIHSTMEAMTEGRFRHLPVLRGDKLVAVISIGDVVKIHIESIENEHRALRDYIASA